MRSMLLLLRTGLSKNSATFPGVFMTTCYVIHTNKTTRNVLTMVIVTQQRKRRYPWGTTDYVNKIDSSG